MNSSHQKTVEQPLVNWLERCKLHFGADFRAVGSGRWCVTTLEDRQRGWMFETLVEAKHVIVDPKRCKITDLADKTVWQKLEALPDDWEDRQWERKQRK